MQEIQQLKDFLVHTITEKGKKGHTPEIVIAPTFQFRSFFDLQGFKKSLSDQVFRHLYYSHGMTIMPVQIKRTLARAKMMDIWDKMRGIE